MIKVLAGRALHELVVNVLVEGLADDTGAVKLYVHLQISKLSLATLTSQWAVRRLMRAVGEGRGVQAGPLGFQLTQVRFQPVEVLSFFFFSVLFRSFPAHRSACILGASRRL